MADKKLTYQMVSPGEAWNNFVNSKDGHNAAAVTPSYLDTNKDKEPAKDLGDIGKSNAPGFSTGKTQSQDNVPKDNQQQQSKDSLPQAPETMQRSNAPNFFSGYQKNDSSMKMDKTKTAEKGIEMDR